MWVRQELYKHCLCESFTTVWMVFQGNLDEFPKLSLECSKLVWKATYIMFFFPPIKKNPLIISHLYFPCLSSDWAGWGCGHGNSAARRSWSCWASWHWPCPWGTCPPGGSRYTTRMAVLDLGGNGTLLAQLFQFVSNEARLPGLKSWNFQQSHLPAI